MEMNDKQKKELLNCDYEVVNDDKPELCVTCPLNRVCSKKFNGDYSKANIKNCVCWYELNGKYKEKQELFYQWQAYTESDSKYFMERLMMTMGLLDKEIVKDPSFAKYMQKIYVEMAVYKMKFGEKKEIQTVNTVNAGGDIKALMEKVRNK